MISILEVLGEDYYVIPLKENNSPYGGKSHINEVLGEFMCDVGIDSSDSYVCLCDALDECGLIL